MSAAASKPTGMTRKDLMCDYCDKNIRDCMCVTAPTHGRYCDDCGRARPYCICSDPTLCVGCERKHTECDCAKCRTCAKRVEECIYLCEDCKYPRNACRCYTEYEAHPDTLCCARCYSDPCECEAHGRQEDLNRTVECPYCGSDAKYCCLAKDRARATARTADSDDD